MEEQLKEIFSNLFSIDKSTIDNDFSMATVSSWDSLRHIQIVVALEESFEIKFTMDEILAMKTFPKVIEILSSKLQ